MKTLTRIITGLTLAGVVCVASAMAAEEPQPTNATAGAKLTRGFVGLVFGWLELPQQMYQSAVEDGPGMAATVGFAKGLGMVCARYMVSAFEFVTFPFPINDYKPMLDPEYPWGYLGAEGTVIVPAPTSRK